MKAVTLQKDAKNPDDYDLPIQEYQQALLLAPWWSDAYFNLASAFELKQEYAQAIRKRPHQVRSKTCEFLPVI